MMRQKVILRKHMTDDGRWDISLKPDLPPLGSVFWIKMNSWGRFALGLGQMPMMGVIMEDEKTWVPVECLEFTNEYEDRS